ncbi:MAG: ribosome-associated translation inhibitor RaiA [Gammaproteobacteria bacterium]|nr:ribosome-associated translation inhibitor RaiA [Gammaproteobacteria bacterium]
MQLNITGHHIEVTDSMRSYVTEKIQKIDNHFDYVGNVHVILSVEKTRQKAEATVNIAGGELFANSEDENLYAAIDSMVDKLDRQIKKHKEKVKDHHRGEKNIIPD